MDELNYLIYTTPLNIAEEKEKFFTSVTYNPQFRYVKADKRFLEQIIQDLEARDKKNTKNYFKAKLFFSILHDENEEITRWAKRLFNKRLTSELHDEALQYIQSYDTSFSNKETVRELADLFEKTIEYFQIPYKIVIEDKHGFNCRPVHSKRKLYISKYANLEYFPAEGVVKHEICHIIRGYNQLFCNLPRLNFYLRTEEGLACYLQDFTTKHGRRSLYQHSVEYLATEVALRGSFRDIYRFMIDMGFNKELAWNRAIRHKFGFSDTKKSGDLMKPSMYFTNEMKVKSFSHKELLKLLSGKISYSQLPLVNDYNGKVQKAKIQEYFQLQ